MLQDRGRLRASRVDELLPELNPHESAIVSGYTAPEFVGINEIMPIITTNHERGSYTEYGPNAYVLRDGLEQPMGTERKLIDVSLAHGEFRSVKVGASVPIYDEELEEVQDSDRDEFYNEKLLLGEQAIQLGMEYSVARYASNTASFASGFSESLSGTARWDDYTNSDPIGDMSRWIGVLDTKHEIPREQLRIALPVDVQVVLSRHPKIMPMNPVTGARLPATPEYIASLLSIQGVTKLVGKYAVSFSKKEPRDTVFAHIWGGICLVYRKIDKPNMRQPLWGAITRRAGYPHVKAPWRNEKIDAQIKDVSDKWGLHVRANDRAFLGASVLTPP